MAVKTKLTVFSGCAFDILDFPYGLLRMAISAGRRVLTGVVFFGTGSRSSRDTSLKNISSFMSAVRKDGPNKIVLDGTQPDVAAEFVETDEAKQIRVSVSPVPADLEAYVFGSREKTVLYVGPAAGEENEEIEVSYKNALLGRSGSLRNVVLAGTLPGGETEQVGDRVSVSSAQRGRLSVASR